VEFLERGFDAGRDDLAAAFALRLLEMAATGGTVAAVLPQHILYLNAYGALRGMLRNRTIQILARLGSGAFTSIGGEVVQAMLMVASEARPPSTAALAWIEAGAGRSPATKEMELRTSEVQLVSQGNPFSATPFSPRTTSHLRNLSDYGRAWQGFVTGDVNRYCIKFWELRVVGEDWQRIVTPPDRTAPYRGRTTLLRWEKGEGSLVRNSNAHNFNPKEVLGSRGFSSGG